VDPRAGLEVLEKRKFFTLPGVELRPLDTDYAIPAPYIYIYIGQLDLNLYTLLLFGTLLRLLTPTNSNASGRSL
jgi:hypothetical protein